MSFGSPSCLQRTNAIRTQLQWRPRFSNIYLCRQRKRDELGVERRNLEEYSRYKADSLFQPSTFSF